MTADDPIIRVEGLKKYYRANEGFIENLFGRVQWVKAVDGVGFELERGETLGIVGESGCGKSTLGKSVFRLIDPTEGEVYYYPADEDEPVELTALSRKQMRERRKDLQYIFQDPFSSMNPRWTVGEIIGEPLEIHDLAYGEARTERIYELLEIVGLNASHAHRYPHEFSGGQRQRIGIARSLAVDPEVIICDEPVSALDVSVQAQILNLLEDLQEEFGLSYLFIAHDLSVVEHISDRVGVMYLGKLAEIGRTDSVFTPPYHPYTEALLSAIPEPDPRWESDRILLEGAVPSPLDPPSGCRFHTRCPRVIPPSEVDVDQGVWRNVMNLRVRLRGASSFEAITDFEASQSDVTSLERREVDELIRSEFDLPRRFGDPSIENAFQELLDHVLEDDMKAAMAVADEKFISPCEQQPPREIPVSGEHKIACFLYDEDISPASAVDIRSTTDSHVTSDD